jgi:AmmeMemoRadiSam system protein B/AmmeMemoRadiSam system protein A
VAAIIAPHAGYVFSGGVAASAFNQIPEGLKYDRIFLIGSSHRSAFNGASVYSGGAYITPLGRVEVDEEVAQQLASRSPVFSTDPQPHLDEHSLEVQLPFLQYHLQNTFKLVPIVIGSVDKDGVARVAESLKPWFRSGDLFVISSDFSHYPGYDEANDVDERTARAIMKNDPQELLQTLVENNKLDIDGLATSLCGWTSVLTLLFLTGSKDNFRYVDVAYRNSGDSGFGDKNRVVGYHGMAVFRANESGNKSEKAYSDSEFSLKEEEKDRLLKRSRHVLEALANDQKPERPGKYLSDSVEAHLGAFVSLYRDGKLRGCIGNLESELPLWKVIDQMTWSAAMNDSRFSPVTSDEVDELSIEVSVLSPLRKISDISEIEPGKHGIIVKKGGRSGTFLPQVASKTGWGREELLGHCARDKAGLDWNGWKDADIFIYEALVFGE